MKRLTNNDPMDNLSTVLNYVFSEGGWAHIRHDGEKEDVPLTEWAKAQCIKHGCDELPGETPEEINETITDCLMDGDGCPVALAYCFASQAVHLRDRLMAIEDILGDDYDLVRLREILQAEKDGRLVVHGWWTAIGADKRGRGAIYRCSACNDCYPHVCKFCPNCGAKMDLEAEEETK